MSNFVNTITVEIGTIRGAGGAISVSYAPERGCIQLYAYDPDDRRKTGIFIGLSDSGFQELKTVVGRVDEAIELEIRRRLQTQSQNSAGAYNSEGCVAIVLSGSNVLLPEDLYTQAAALVADGKTLLAASLINKSLSWISLLGAKELAQAICNHQQATGIRK